jgi:hypothetical protein
MKVTVFNGSPAGANSATKSSAKAALPAGFKHLGHAPCQMI